MEKIRAGLYRDFVVSKDGVSHTITVERLTSDVSSEKGWSFMIDGSELSEPYPTMHEAQRVARATFFGYHR